MAGASLLTLLDDIATLLDDVALMTKVAAQKTAGVLGDDLALNAQQVAGVRAEREIPVVWAVAKGSLLNKAILVPLALLISAFVPWAVTPLLMVGGAFLCFEGCEKLVHRFLQGAEEVDAKPLVEPVDMSAFENDKVKGAIRTDFILSAEIITITLGTVATAPFLQQVTVLSGIAVIMTTGVYGLVAGIVKLDDLGLWMTRQGSHIAQKLGYVIVGAAPWLMKTLTVAGTAAMFLVGGGILAHGVPWLHHPIEAVGAVASQWPAGAVWQVLVPNLLNAVLGVLAGAIVLAVVLLGQRLRGTAY